MKKLKPVLQVVEHFVLFGLVVAAVAFYVGVQYGQAHVDVKSLKTAPVASQASK